LLLEFPVASGWGDWVFRFKLLIIICLIEVLPVGWRFFASGGLCDFTRVACLARVFFSFLQQKEKNQKKVPPFVQSLRGTKG
jgi:hypothetical protein